MDTKPYVFISYAHKNNEYVIPAIRQMQAQGISLWYDNGIEAGSEWPEYVAEKVLNCDKFVLFVSNAYLQSQNCKRELNYAISRKKEILSVYLEDVNLSPGMEMQLGTYQAFFCNRFPSKEHAYAALAKEHFFNACRVQGGSSVPKKEPVYNGQVGQNTYTPPRNTPTYNAQAGQNTYTSPRNTPTYNAQGGQNTYTPPRNTPPYNANAGQSGSSSRTGSSAYSWNNNSVVFNSANAKKQQKNKIVAIVLALLFGGFGVHKFYLGKQKQGMLYLIFFWTMIPFYLAVIDCIMLAIQSNDIFDQKYNS